MTLVLPNSIKFIITDFDGILTDNCVYIDSHGEISRKLNFKDIMGISILVKNGYQIAIVSGEENSAIKILSDKFNIKEIHQNIRKKLPVLEDIVNRYNLTKEDFLYIGDDINDIDALCYAKYKMTVPNAVSKVKELEGIQITSECGGNGAFREVVDTLIP